MHDKKRWTYISAAVWAILVLAFLAPVTFAQTSDDASLTSLTIDADGTALSISPAISPETTNYTAVTDSTRVVITATPSRDGATVTLSDGTFTVTNESSAIELGPVATTITATVTAEDGIIQRAYRIVITRPISAGSQAAGQAALLALPALGKVQTVLLTPPPPVKWRLAAQLPAG